MTYSSRNMRTGLAGLAALFFLYFAYLTWYRDGDSPWRQPQAAPLEEADRTVRPQMVDAVTHSYPSDYEQENGDDEWCESLYSPRYLEYTASHHVPYCEAGSRSTFECFHTHTSDPLCIAQGVIVDHTRMDPLKGTAMDCKMRNFTAELLEKPELGTELEGVQNVAEMRSYFFDTGVMEQLKSWDFSVPRNDALGGCDAKSNDGKWTLLVKREGNQNIWHKLMELWQSMLTLDVLQIAINTKTRQPYLSAADLHNVQVVFEDNDVAVVDDWWSMLTGNSPIRKNSMPPTCFGNVILPLAGSSSPFWQAHWDDKDCRTTFLLNAFLRRLFRHLSITPTRHGNEESIIVTIIDRQGETRKIFDLQGHVERARNRWPEAIIQAIDFATIPLKQQVEMVHKSDVLVGVTGAAMTHVLWLAEESSVAEIFTPDLHYSGFRNLAKMRNLNYFTSHSVNITAFGQTHEDWVKHVEGHAASTADEKSTATEVAPEPVKEKRYWQSDAWLYMSDESFQALIDAAINGALNRGLSSSDVIHRPMK